MAAEPDCGLSAKLVASAGVGSLLCNHLHVSMKAGKSADDLNLKALPLFPANYMHSVV